jgi:hypothetical protein
VVEGEIPGSADFLAVLTAIAVPGKNVLAVEGRGPPGQAHVATHPDDRGDRPATRRRADRLLIGLHHVDLLKENQAESPLPTNTAERLVASVEE